MFNTKKHTYQTIKKVNEPICIEQMTFQKTLGPNDTGITMVSGKAGREQKASTPRIVHATC